VSNCHQTPLTCGFPPCRLTHVKASSLSGRERVMADLAYALLLIGSFLALGLTVRGLEKL